MVKNIKKSGFTIVEILVVIVVIGILATVSVVGYGSWRKTAAIAQVKSDLNAAASAMENALTFANSYPLVLPTTIKASSGVTLSGGSIDGKTYCVDGVSAQSATILYYVDSTASNKGAQAGTCATRPNLPAPSVPGNLAVVVAVGTQVNLSWTAVVNAASYTIQCASDAGFIVGVRTVSVTSPTVTTAVGGLSPSSTYYCRVNAINANSTSAWSASVSTTTTNAYGSLAVASSLEGYWTNTPQGFLIENGAEVSRSTYTDLFAAIGTTYGAGDGSTTFNLPDSRGRTPVSKNTSDSEFAAIGQETGSKTELLTIAQIPSHSHVQNAHTHGVSDPGHNHSQNAHVHGQVVTANSGGSAIRKDYRSDGAAGAYAQGVNTSDATATNNPALTGLGINSATATNQATGSDAAHNNIQPSIVKLSVIKYAPIDSMAASLPAATSINGYWSAAPANYLFEDGTAVSRSVYADLFAAIGTTYGVGDGSTTFNLPDSRGRVSVNKSTDTEFDAMGEKTGSKTELLTIAQIPSHSHVQNAHTHGVSDPGHNHSQNAHVHGQVVTANSGGSAVRNDYNGDGDGGVYSQGVTTYATAATNNGAYTGVSINNATATNQNTGGGGSHNNIQPSIVKLSAIKYNLAVTTGVAIPSATSIGGYWSVVPSGYLAEDGTAISRTTYSSLFAAIGTTYGVGDGSTTFNLPDSRGRVSVNLNIADAEFNTMGEKYGTKIETLLTAQMPVHTHIQNAHTHGVNDPGHNHSQNAHAHGQVVTNPLAGWPGIRSDYAADAAGGTYAQGANTDATAATNNGAYTGVSINNATATNQNTGGGGSHNNIQPSIVKFYAIKY